MRRRRRMNEQRWRRDYGGAAGRLHRDGRRHWGKRTYCGTILWSAKFPYAHKVVKLFSSSLLSLRTRSIISGRTVLKWYGSDILRRPHKFGSSATYNLRLKFIYSEKATNFCEISTLLLTATQITNAQRGSSLYCSAENSIPIPNF